MSSAFLGLSKHESGAPKRRRHRHNRHNTTDLDDIYNCAVRNMFQAAVEGSIAGGGEEQRSRLMLCIMLQLQRVL
jgi:hypothetical protein